LSNQPGPTQASSASGAAATALPDLNAETYPFSVVHHLIDQAAYINAYAICNPAQANVHIQGASGSDIGFELKGVLHRFDINFEAPSRKSGVTAKNIVGRSLGEFTHRWLVIPDNFAASPDRNPAPTALDPSRSQRFVMEDGVFKFGDSGFRGFGTGATYPVNSGGEQQLFAAAVGEVLDSYGKFEGLEGSYVLSGQLSKQGAFEGNVQIRVLDPRGQIRTDSDVGPAEGILEPNLNLSYLVFRGQKKNENVKTTYVFGPGGMPAGFKLKQELRIVDLHSNLGRSRRLRSSVRLGQVIGWMSSEVFLNILNPGAPGTSLAPIPFSSYNVFTFTDDAGNAIGSFTAEGGEGRSFNVKLAGAPGQQALRFGAFQTLTNGTGYFEGVRGLFTDNSIVGVAPHVTSTLYTACICDPEGKFRAK
jgi:hypothetical protein